MRYFIQLLLCGVMLFFSISLAFAGPMVFGTMSSATVRVKSTITVTEGVIMSSPSVDVISSTLSVYADDQSQLIEYTLLTTTSGNGTITCPPFVEHGFTANCTVKPNTGNKINAVTGCGGNLIGEIFTTSAITADCTISAAFNLDLPPVAAISPTAIDFGNFLMGSVSSSVGATVTNSGIGNPLTVTGYSLSGLTPEAFSFANGGDKPCPALPFSLNAGISCTLSISFNPASTGQKSAIMHIASNDPAAPLTNLTFSGAAVNQYQTLSLAFSGTGSGSIAFSSGTVCSTNCDQSILNASTVTLTPTATLGSSFIGWSGCDSVSNNICTVTMTSGRSFDARFALDSAAGSFAWRATGPVGVTVNTVVVNPITTAILYAGTNIGVYKSDDGGTTWNSAGLVSSRIISLAIHPTTPATLYAGTAAGIFKTTNAGSSWSAQGLATAKVQALAIDPAAPATIYAGTDSGVFKSLDAAGIWDQLDLGGSVSVLSLIIDPTASARIYVSTTGGSVYKTADHGSTWMMRKFASHSVTNYIPQCVAYYYGNCTYYQPFPYTSYIDDPVQTIALDPVLPSTLFAGSSMQLYKSTDSGSSWIAMPLTKSLSALAIDATNSATIFAGTADGVFKTTDGGLTWSAVNSGLTTLSTEALAFDPAGYKSIYAGTPGGGVFKASFASTIALSPASLTFGSVATNSISNSQTVTINNPSTADLVVAAIHLSGTNSGEFSITEGTCGSLAPTIPPGSSCGVNVTFTPTSIGTKTATVQVDSNASNAPHASADLGGTAYDPPPFGFVTINGGAIFTTSRDVTLTVVALDNSGTVADMRFSNDNSSWSSWDFYATVKAWTLMPLGGDGTKTVFVQFRDAAGNTSGSFADTIILDTTTPTVTITSKPAALFASKNGAITFTTSETAVTYCSLDGVAATTCVSPWNFSAVSDGNHTLTIYAVDRAGLTGTPVSHTWKVDTAPPDSTIIGKPVNPTNQTGGSFSFTASETGSIFQCSLDGTVWSNCAALFGFSGLIDGSHTFKVRAIDPAGNIGQAASYTWIVDTNTPKNVMIQNLSSYFATLSEAFGAFTSGSPALIQARDMNFAEVISFDRCGESVTLKGGYASDFIGITGDSKIKGSITIKCGSLIVDGITVR